MQVWQTIWDPQGELLICGEKTIGSTAESQTQLPQNNRFHPFSCTHEEIRDLLSQLEFSWNSERTLTLFLPTDSNAPVFSRRLRSEAHDEQAESITLEPWQLPVIGLSPYHALCLLTSSPESGGSKFGDSFLFWREVAKLLLELLSRGRFIPGVSLHDSDFNSCWHLLPHGAEDQQRLNVLTSAMPPVCHAFAEKSHSEIDARYLIESFLSTSADALIRFFFNYKPLISDQQRSQLSARFPLQIDWVLSLTRADKKLNGPRQELTKFRNRIHGWSRTLLPSRTLSAICTYFRISPPVRNMQTAEDVTDTQHWKVTFGLAVSGEHSGEATAASLWSGKAGVLYRLGYDQEQLEDRLLEDLGVALRNFPLLRQALNSPYPTHLYLTLNEAYLFLKETSASLEQDGFIVHVPSSLRDTQVKFGLHFSVKSTDAGLASQVPTSFLSAQTLFDFSWQVVLGEKQLTIDEFKKLTEEHSPLIEVDGEWIELSPKRLEKTLNFLEAQQKRVKLNLREALRIGYGVEHDPEILPVVSFTTEGWLGQLLDAKQNLSGQNKIATLREPEGFIGTLRPYQCEGLTWLAFISAAGIGGCLADDMGLGKTIQMLALLLHERQTAAQASSASRIAPTLLIVPMSILANWEQEAQRFSPTLNVYLHHGAERLFGKAFVKRTEDVDIVITTYSIAHRDETLLTSISWGRIALDEAQNIKNLEAKQTQAIRRLVQAKIVQAQSGEFCHRLALTGTPLENHLEELWSIFDFLNPGLLGSLYDFRTRFVLPIERYRAEDAAERLSKLIRPFVLRRLKTDPTIIDDLPEKIEMEVLAPLTEEQVRLYQSVLEEMLPQVDQASGIHRKGLVLGTITRLKQICNHPSLFLKDGQPLSGRSGKLAAVEEILEIVLAEKDRVLLFTQYAQMGHLLKPYLEERFDCEVLFLHGGLHRHAREDILRSFREPHGPPIFILSLKAGGFGLNLTEANQIIHYDQWWNPAVEEQATDRAFRIGQKRTVQVRKFVCKGTLEEKIRALVAHKRHLAEQVVGSTRSMITQLSLEELRGLLELKDAEIEQ